jgi:hypothetical protein
LKTELFKLQELGEITEAEFQKLKDIQESLQPDALGTLHWDLELEEINARSQLSVEILDSSSLMESSAIPVEVLCKATCQDNQDDEFRQGLNLLQEFSLINWNKDEGNCSMHSLVQESVVKRVRSLGSISSRYARLARCLNSMIPQLQTYGAIQQNVHNKKVVALSQHLLCLCGRILDAQCIKYDDMWNFVQRCCWLAILSHDVSTAKQLAETKLRVIRQSPRVNNLGDVIYTLLSLADCYENCGKLRNSTSIVEEALKIRQSAYLAPHPNLAIAIR